MRFPLPAIRCTLRPAHLLWRQLVVRLSSQHTTAISTPLHSRCLLFLSGSLHRCTFSEDSTRDIHKRQRRGSVSSLPGCGPKRSPLARIWPHQVPLQLAAGPHAPNDEQLIRVCEPGLTRLATCGPTETFCNLIRRMGDNFRDARVCFDGQRLDGSERILSCIDPDIGGFPLVDLFLEQTGGGGNSPEVKRLKADVKRLKADVKRLEVEMELLKGARSTAFAAAAVPGAGPSEISAAFATASTAVVSAAAAAPSSTAVISAASSSTTPGSASAIVDAAGAACCKYINNSFHIHRGRATTWADVYGAAAGVKQMTDAFFHSLQYPRMWRGCAAPKVALLLHGPPGTGKDSAARATVNHAHELSEVCGRKFTIFTPTGTDIRTGADARALFSAARENAPSIIFFNECQKAFGGDSQRVQELKTEIEKLQNMRPCQVLLLCASNKADDIDSAIKSRFDLAEIELPLPDEAARRAILETELRDNQTSLSESDWATILQSTGSKSGRHLQQLCAQAATTVILEVTDDASEPRAIKFADFEEALMVVGGGSRAGPSGSTSAAASQQAPPAPGALVVASAAAAPPAGGLDHAKRVAACRRLFTRVTGSPRRFRHEVYAYIAQHERDAWETVGTADQRAKAVKDPATLKLGSRPAGVIVSAWADAMAGAFPEFEFENIRGEGAGLPRGHSTTELAFKAV
jgi:AAA+ superfamily predicted ATPase